MSINGSIYTHPIGFHGHAAGPTIGMWDQQNGVPGSGDFPMHYPTNYSIELNAASFIKEWYKEVGFMLEQDGHFDEKFILVFRRSSNQITFNRWS
jgi:hypothetical protein